MLMWGRIHWRDRKKCGIIMWSEHSNPKEKTEPSMYLSSYISHSFALEVLMSAPKYIRTRKNVEAFFIAFQKPSLNEQVKPNVLHIFRDSIT